MLPLSACVLLRRWSHEPPRSLEEAQAQLREAAAAPERVSRWRRAVPIAMAAAPILFFGLMVLALLPADIRILTGEEIEVVGLLSVLQTDLPPGSPMSRPENRVALETYLAGQHGAVLRDTSLWSNPTLQNQNGPVLGRMASDIATRYPSVTKEEVARSLQTIQPFLGRELHQRGVGVKNAALFLASMITAGASVVVLLFSVVSSIAVRGGVATRSIGLAVVTQDGKEISRWRSLARTLIAWLPMLVASVPMPALISQGQGPAVLVSVGVALAAMIAGVVWTIAAADRGLHDRIAGTWVVPR